MKIERNISSDSPSARTLCGVLPITNLFDPLKNLQRIVHIPDRISRFLLEISQTLSLGSPLAPKIIRLLSGLVNNATKM